MGVWFLFNKLLQYILSPIIFVVLFIPFYLYRLLVILIGKCTLPSGSEIIELRNALFSPCFSSLSPMGSLIAPYLFNTSLDISQIHACFTKFSMKYKRLRSVPELHWLYCFWVPVPEEKFSLKNHIQEICLEDRKIVPASSDSKVSSEQFITLKKVLLEEAFAKDQSPWMLYIVRNVEHERHGQCDAAILKWHHGLADGISILKMFGEALEPQITPPKINFPRIPGWLDTLMSVRAFFNIFDSKLMGRTSVGKSIISPSGAQMKKGNDFYLAESEPIPIELIKTMKNENNVSFNSVVLTALSSALRSYVIQKEGKDTKIPDEVKTCVVLPYPGHPDNDLTNYWSWTMIQLPISGSTTESQSQILQSIFGMLKNSKEKILKNFKRFPIFGRLPFLFHGSVLSPHSIVFSDFPGPTHKVNIWGSQCLDMSFHINAPPGIIGMFCTSLSYNGKWKFAFTIDGAVAHSQQDADDLANMVASRIAENTV